MYIKFLDILDRAHTGEVRKLKDWDLKIIAGKVREKLKEHGLEKTIDIKNPINTDDGLADKFWKAGFELAVEVGMLCMSTDRVIKFTEEELRQSLNDAPDEMKLGGGKDSFKVVARRPSDGKHISPWLGAFGMALDENLYVPVTMANAQYKVIDATIPGTLKSIYGRPIRSRTPYETLAGNYEARLQREALKTINRPMMTAQGGCSAPTEYGNFGGVGVPGGADPKNNLNVALATSELKTDYTLLHKVAHFINCETYVYGGHFSFIGGFAGPPEGAALTSVAAACLLVPVHQASFQYVPCLNTRDASNSGRETVWASSVSAQAISRNTHLLPGAVVNPVSGPGTEMLLQEVTVSAMNAGVSGYSFSEGVRSAGGRYANYTSGVENKYAAEVMRASAGIDRKLANEIANELIPKFEDKLMSPPIGVPFTECFDIVTLQPKKEWKELYDKYCKFLLDRGVDLSKAYLPSP
ncbi:MAG: monomethylamine:corrinoid methyltransferase [Methanobacteriota archaeon]